MEPQFTVHTGARPDLLFDYYGFPEHTYALRWDAPGAPDVAGRAAQLLAEAGIATGTEHTRGWDHGVFIPLKVAVPDADIPIAQISLLGPERGQDYDALRHLEAGRALAPLRDEGVLIIGSGMSFHNMRARNGSVQEQADMFDAALSAVVTSPDPATCWDGLSRWSVLAHAHIAHPRFEEEHLIPLMLVAGAGNGDIGTHIFRDQVIGWTVSAYRFG